MPPPVSQHLVRISPTLLHDQGQGIFAVDAIKKGEFIMADQPILAVEFSFLKRELTPDEEDFWTDAVGRIRALSDEASQAWVGMISQIPHVLHNGRFVLTPFSGRIRSNLIPYSLGRYQPKAHELGLFPTLSKLNHSCKPNAAQTWNPETLQETIYALEDINPGEQVTISYFPEARIDRKLVQNLFRFQCACRWCLQDDSPAKKAGEANRATIEELANEFEKLDMDEALENCHHRLILIHKEGICDWRKGLAYEDALDIVKDDLQDVERGKFLAVLAFLSYYMCEGWDTSKGIVLGAKYATLVIGMTKEEGKELVLAAAEEYIKGPERIIVGGAKNDDRLVIQFGKDTNVEDNSVQQPPANVQNSFDPDKLWEQLTAPLARPDIEEGEVDDMEMEMLEYENILESLLLIKDWGY